MIAPGFLRCAAALLLTAASFAPLPAAADTLVYVGEYTCGNGQQRSRLRLVIETLDVEPVTAVFHFDTYQGAIAKGSFRLSGTYNPTEARLHLLPAGWIDRPEGYRQVGLDGTFSDGTARLAGKVVDETCERFSLVREGAAVKTGERTGGNGAEAGAGSGAGSGDVSKNRDSKKKMAPAE